MGYPTSVFSPTTKNNGDVVQASHINDLQTEVTAVETDLLAAWTDVSFSAGNFTGSGSMTWTVASGDQGTFAYRKTGKTMTVAFGINTSSVGGTPSTQLIIAIPGGFTAAKSISNAIHYLDNGTRGNGYCQVITGTTAIICFKSDAGNWTASTDLTYVLGQITFETTT